LWGTDIYRSAVSEARAQALHLARYPPKRARCSHSYKNVPYNRGKRYNSKDETMLEITLNCQPDPQTLTQRVQIVMQEQKSLETLLDEAIAYS
jgi:hypothetical protein